jgi:DNA mismatch repair ATPase MutS
MGMIAEAKRIKEIHPDYLILYKSGSFYKVFGKDAYIVAAVFNYSIKIVDNNVAIRKLINKNNFYKI